MCICYIVFLCSYFFFPLWISLILFFTLYMLQVFALSILINYIKKEKRKTVQALNSKKSEASVSRHYHQTQNIKALLLTCHSYIPSTDLHFKGRWVLLQSDASVTLLCDRREYLIPRCHIHIFPWNPPSPWRQEYTSGLSWDQWGRGGTH